MNSPVLELLDTGLGVSIQDRGRRGWKQYGVPVGGVMDDHAAVWANRLLENLPHEPVLEILFHGARFRALQRVEIALTGAATARGRLQGWEAWSLAPEEEVVIAPPTHGVWTYLAVRGGISAPIWFGSVSIFPRGGLGEPLTAGTLLRRRVLAPSLWTSAIGSRWAAPAERRRFDAPPSLRVWRGPQWNLFTEEQRARFFSQPWTVSPSCDRSGYRLQGSALAHELASIPSEPVLPGSIQVPPDGLPIVTFRDGPTVGGYPKIGLVDPADLSRLAQARTGQTVTFVPHPPPVPAESESKP